MNKTICNARTRGTLTCVWIPAIEPGHPPTCLWTETKTKRRDCTVRASITSKGGSRP